MNKHSHFWEIIFPITDIKNQKQRCMICGKIKNREIPKLNLKGDKDD